MLPTSRPSATPTTCGCQFETAAISSPATATPSDSPTLSLSVSQSPAVSVTQTPQPTTDELGIVATQDDIPDQPLQGQVISGEVPTSLLKKPLSYLVYLPPGYDSQSAHRYPVLYLLHGQGSTNDQWVRLGITTTADRLIGAGSIAPMLIVMPYEADAVMPEQTNFGEAVVSVLVPWIDAHYPTQADRVARAIGGLSRGAAWAVRLGLMDWQTFGAIGAHSFPEFYGDGTLIPEWLAAIPPASYPRFYLDIGRSDPGIQLVVDFEAYLTAQGIPHEFHMYTGYHEENYWQTHLEYYLRWYAAGWQ